MLKASMCGHNAYCCGFPSPLLSGVPHVHSAVLDIPGSIHKGWKARRNEAESALRMIAIAHTTRRSVKGFLRREKKETTTSNMYRAVDRVPCVNALCTSSRVTRRGGVMLALAVWDALGRGADLRGRAPLVAIYTVRVVAFCPTLRLRGDSEAGLGGTDGMVGLSDGLVGSVEDASEKEVGTSSQSLSSPLGILPLRFSLISKLVDEALARTREERIGY